VLTLTGPELLGVPDMVRQLGQTLGRELSTVDVALESYRAQMLAAGIDPLFAEVAVNGSRQVAQNGGATLTDDVRDVIGRPPRTFATWAQDHRDAFGG
jgi:uncharacterized protein YbjT (DUF2867 family)